MCILVVDDDAGNCELQKRVLQRHGYSTLCCYDGADAMEVIERTRPDVILLDLAMPQMDGFAVAEELQHNPDLKPKALIALTGYGDDVMRERIAAAGFDYCLVKPVGWADLSSILERCH